MENKSRDRQGNTGILCQIFLSSRDGAGEVGGQVGDGRRGEGRYVYTNQGSHREEDIIGDKNV